MTITEMFNQQLETLPVEKERLIERLEQMTIFDENWNETKRRQAILIVQDEKFELDTQYFESKHHSFVSMKPRYHFFSLEECSIEDMDSSILDKYVQSLLDDLNDLSKIIKFSIVERDNFHLADGGRVFGIECTF